MTVQGWAFWAKVVDGMSDSLGNSTILNKISDWMRKYVSKQENFIVECKPWEGVLRAAYPASIHKNANSELQQIVQEIESTKK
jgi:hypothetical protein